MAKLTVEVAPIFQPLLAPARYKGICGGRGKGASWFFASRMVVEHIKAKTDSICLREFLKSLQYSSKKLIEETICRMNAGDYFDVQNSRILAKNGGVIIFDGMSVHTSDSIKSLEGFDRAWFEESQNASQRSLNLLRPTIRKDGSELWFSWNPLKEDDPIEQLLRGDNPIDDRIVIEANLEDMPPQWIPKELLKEREADRKIHTPDTFNNIWGGKYLQNTEGDYYKFQLDAVREQNRICFIPRLDIPVNTFWDIGNSDGTAIWFHQQVGMEDRFIGYHEDHGKTLADYYKELQRRGYIYNKHFLPHDAFHERLSNDNKSVAQMLADLGLGEIDKNIIKVDVIPELNTGILMTRKHFPSAFFDKEDCKLGIARLKNYRKVFIQSEQRWVDRPNKANGCSEGCLIGDTLVLLRSGLTRIDAVNVGDEVWTPSGFAKVLQSGAVKLVYEILLLEFSNGEKLLCTPEHKIMSEKGFVYADALRCYDKVFHGGELSCKINSLFSMVTNIGFRQVTTKLKTGGVMVFLLGCIKPFGLHIMEQFQRVMKYTISTSTQQTTILQTSHVFQSTITSDSMLSRELWKEHLTRQAKKHCVLPLCGIQHQKGLNGIVTTALIVGKKGCGTLLNALFAGMNLLHLIQQGLNIAQKDASMSQERLKTEEKKILSNFADNTSEKNKQKNKLSVKSMFASVLFAVTNFMQRCRQELNIAQKGVRILRVSTVKVGKSGVLVYDLKIEKHQCYKASGIIVSNSDAFRQWAQAKEAGLITMANAKIRKLSDRKYTQGGQGGSGGWMGT